MNDPKEPKRILIIDRQKGWRDEAALLLSGRGFSVGVLDHYDYSPAAALIAGRPPDLVILGCPGVGRGERELIHKVFEHKQHLLVLSTSLRWSDMRALFLAGADDVMDKPYESARLMDVVQQAFNNISSRSSYEQVSQGGAL
jgi:DNA-binding response OmpR family regulator